MSRSTFGIGSKSPSPSSTRSDLSPGPTTFPTWPPNQQQQGDKRSNSASSSSSNAHGGVLKTIGLATPTLSIHLLEETLYLHPAHEGPTEDPSVSGSVVLWLPKAKQLKGLSVRLLGRQDIGWTDGRPYESHIILDKVVKLFHEDTMLEKGEHVFAFDIIVPSSSATYERCMHGRVRHTVTAKAKGLGSLGGDVVSEEKMLFLIVNPGGAGASEPPPPLTQNLEGHLEDLGVRLLPLSKSDRWVLTQRGLFPAQPYTISLQSQHVMVGGLLLLKFAMIDPPHDVILYSIKVKINQHYLLRSAIDPSHTHSPPTDARLALILDANHPPNYGNVEAPNKSNSLSNLRSGSHTPHGVPLKYLSTGQEWRVKHLTRIPNDNVIRPSTQVGTETGINISHTISVEVTYKVGSPEDAAAEERRKNKQSGKPSSDPMKDRKKMIVTRPLDLFSCCSFLDSLMLPAYAVKDPNPSPDTHAPPCVCGMRTLDVIKWHGNKLLLDDPPPSSLGPLPRRKPDEPANPVTTSASPEMSMRALSLSPPSSGQSTPTSPEERQRQGQYFPNFPGTL